MKVSALVLALAAISAGQAEAHSWLDCLDWDKTTNSCKGYSRNFHVQPSVPFAADVGLDQRPQADVPAGLVAGPRQRPNANVEDGYSADFPMATLKAGQTITMRWPAKNRVASSSTSPAGQVSEMTSPTSLARQTGSQSTLDST
eukprot:CAMPEP_0171456958 /NCGR_PEP_ID=MMETSP0945-20130129/3234_1 /TAXON_ID=109269 /ORGANISM="Vaucheria litorea, Strain CCMP2940" /LENGTH=143 /DNA_ID=CAMNT_0011982481 /DNA_START=57 /DNA_END=484 /DNA_ORIENTATION=+